MPAGAARAVRALALGTLPLALIVAWSNLFDAGYQFDDWEVIVRDPRVQGLDAWWAGMPGIRPLLKLSYALNHASGFGLRGFQAVNLGIHAANGALVFWLLSRWLVRAQPAAPAEAAWAAFAATAIFLLHPVQTEAVTYVSGRSTSLCALFSLASIAAWVRGEHRPGWRYGASPLLLLLALATKEMAAMVPFALLLWEATAPGGFDGRAVLRRTALHWLIAGAVLLMALSLPAYQRLLAASLGHRGVLENLLAQPAAIAWLAGQLLRFDRLNADPALTPAFGVGFAVAGVALVAALGVFGRSLGRQPVLAFAIGWFLLWLLPTNSVLARLDLANDRQLYLPLVGPALLVGLGIAGLARHRVTSALVVTVALATMLGTATWLRNRVYADEVAFWSDVALKSPHNARAFNNLGLGLAARCDLPGAAAAWEQALRLDPDYMRAAVNRRLLAEGVLPEGIGPCE